MPTKKKKVCEKQYHQSTFEARPDTMNALEDFVREGAARMLQAALESEVADYIQSLSHLVDGEGSRLVVRNGTIQESRIQNGIGPIPI